MKKIRITQKEDVPDIKAVLDATNLFPSEMLDDMIASHLEDAKAAYENEIWLSLELDGRIIGFCYAIQEQMTHGTWNLLALAINPQNQGQGCGTSMVHQLEERLGNAGHRLLIIDTSGSDDFSQTRDFYLKAGYEEEARIRDFWAHGEDKITFVKKL